MICPLSGCENHAAASVPDATGRGGLATPGPVVCQVDNRAGKFQPGSLTLNPLKILVPDWKTCDPKLPAEELAAIMTGVAQ